MLLSYTTFQWMEFGKTGRIGLTVQLHVAKVLNKDDASVPLPLTMDRHVVGQILKLEPVAFKSAPLMEK